MPWLRAAAVDDQADRHPAAPVPGIEPGVDVGDRHQVAEAQAGRAVAAGSGRRELEVQVPHRNGTTDAVADQLARDCRADADA